MADLSGGGGLRRLCPGCRGAEQEPILLNHAVAKLQQSLGWPCWRCGAQGGAPTPAGEISQAGAPAQPAGGRAGEPGQPWAAVGSRRSTSMCPWCSRGSASTGRWPTSPQPRLPHQPARADPLPLQCAAGGRSDASPSTCPRIAPACRWTKSVCFPLCAAGHPCGEQGEPITAEVLASHNQISLHPHPPLGGLERCGRHRLEGDPLS